MYIRTMTSHDEQEVMINTDHIVQITYFPESNMSRIDTVLQGNPVWVDDNFMDKLMTLGVN